ncbi:MAG: hypothetical protein JNJ86_16955 [Chitinophagaceae bacterium]|nr:hypothetical protein [Chitinophagaceae bacterium]
MSKVDAIKFRMYDTGSVGDCLLLLFQKQGQTSFSMLIDCGGFSTSTAKISPAVLDIQKTCGGKLDLLVVTHQHLDHVSGFNQAKTIFDQITVKDVWMSWIENKNDAVAKVLKTKFGKTLARLQDHADRALQVMGNTNQVLPPVKDAGKRLEKRKLSMQNTRNLVHFELGFEPGQKALKGAKPTNDQAMDYVRNKGKIQYRLPGEVIKDITGAEGMKFFMLGPPRDRDMKFFKIALKDEEMYHLAMNSPTDEGEMPEEERLLNTGIDLVEGRSPFADEFLMDAAAIRAFNKVYNSEAFAWRQIETDWLETSASIALKATRLTNNTSLAMAIEFEDSGRVILLPGDAQSGNWMGWHKPDVSQQLKDNGGKTTVELLNHTVFYKVGHHGSHNGTASVSGLEYVKSPDLVAMMPLIQNAIPEEWGGSTNFPAKPLYKVLIDKTKGRLIRTDQGVVTAAKAKELRGQLTREEKKEFTNSFAQGSCYVEYVIRG